MRDVVSRGLRLLKPETRRRKYKRQMGLLQPSRPISATVSEVEGSQDCETGPTFTVVGRTEWRDGTVSRQQFRFNNIGSARAAAERFLRGGGNDKP